MKIKSLVDDDYLTVGDIYDVIDYFEIDGEVSVMSDDYFCGGGRQIVYLSFGEFEVVEK